MKDRSHEILSLIILTYCLAFILNFIWEHLHHVLYNHYQGGEITDFILFYVSVFDALFIVCISLPFIVVKKIRPYAFIIAIVGIIFAVSLERFALLTERWAYTEAMPIIPLINTGLTPSIQLGILGIASYSFALFVYNKRKPQSIFS